MHEYVALSGEADCRAKFLSYNICKCQHISAYITHDRPQIEIKLSMEVHPDQTGSEGSHAYYELSMPSLAI